MISKDLIISYRQKDNSYSEFITLSQIEEMTDSKKAMEIFVSIYKKITQYDPNKADPLKEFERKLFSRVIYLQEAKIDEMNKNIHEKKMIFFSILSFGVIFLIYLIEKKQILKLKNQAIDIHENGLPKSFEKMYARNKEKEIFSKPVFLIELENNQLQDVDKEFKRLQSIERIGQAFSRVSKKVPYYWKKATKASLVAYGRSLELQQKLKDTHYVINHGQRAEMMVLNMLACILSKTFEAKNFEGLGILRHNSMLSTIDENIHKVEWYKKRLIADTDHNYRKELICGDCDLESSQAVESALYFFLSGTNVASGRSFLKNLFFEVIGQYISDENVVKKLSSNLLSIIKKYHVKGGNLYSICIPKEKFDESCFFSRPYGTPYGKNDEGIFRENLEKIQEGTSKNIGIKPQVRVLTHKIKPEDGFYVMLNSALPEVEIYQEIDLLVQDALLGITQ